MTIAASQTHRAHARRALVAAGPGKEWYWNPAYQMAMTKTFEPTRREARLDGR